MKKTLLRNKKGQLGMDVAKSFMLGLMTLLIIGVVVLIVTTSLSDTDLALDEFSVSNETGGYINSSGYTLSEATTYGFTSVSITEARNGTDGASISSGNFTVSSAGVVTNTTDVFWNSALFDYTYKANNEVVFVTDNSSAGISSFFEDTTTWLALLGVVIIILIIAIVISVVNRFGQEGRSKGGSSGVTF